MSKRTSKKKAAKEEEETTEAVPETPHYDFDENFITIYRTLLTMILERGYSGDGLIGVEPSEAEDPSILDRDEGLIGEWKITFKLDDQVEIRHALTEAYGGLEKFSLALVHPDPRLNMLVYYLFPELESHESAQERKQLSQEQIRTYIRLLDETNGEYTRLMLISKIKPAADAVLAIEEANYKMFDEQPLRLISFYPASFFMFNPMQLHLQPRNIRIQRGEDKRRILGELGVDTRFQGQEDTIVPRIGAKDPLVMYYGAKVDELITFTRDIPNTHAYMRIVIPDFGF